MFYDGPFRGQIYVKSRMDMEPRFYQVNTASLYAVFDGIGIFRQENPSLMNGSSLKSSISVVSAFENYISMVALQSGIKRARPPGATVCAPDLRLVLSIDADCIMPWIAPIILTNRSILILKTARVYDHTMPFDRQFEAECIAVRMSGLIVRAHRTTVDDQTLSGGAP